VIPAASPRRAAPGTALLLVLGVAWVAGCSTGAGSAGSPGVGSSTAASAAQPAPSQPTVSWSERCTDQVTYWAKDVLLGHDAGLDYQEMGLSGTTNEALQAVLAEAKSRPEADGEPTAGWIRTRAARECQARGARAASRASSSPGGWP
jgi:hypothetical protein